MRLGEFTFQPAPIPSLITLLILPLLLALGFWQLDRAQQKEAIQSTYTAHAALPPVPVTAVDMTDPGSRYRKVIAEGRYDGRYQILLDNQVQGGQPGFHVFTPLRIPGKAEAILVNRGWVPLEGSRQQLPAIAVTEAAVMVRGRLAQPANPGLRLGEPEASDLDWPRIVSYVDYERLAAELGYPLAPAVILLDPEAEQGYRRKWRPLASGFGPERHTGYAVQWFSLAVTLVGISIVVNTRRNCRVKKRGECEHSC